MTITALITVLLKHVGLLVAGAFVLLTISPVQELNFKKNSIYNRLFLIVFFGLFGILGTYSGNAIFHSIANLRAMAVVTAGLFGGPFVGFGAGLIAGGHRFVIDPWGFSAVACSLATIIEGLIAGYLHLYYKERSMDWTKGMLLAFAGEMLHMGLVLVLSRPFGQAVELVQVIALPMLIGNTLGAGLFIHVIKSLQEFREKKDSTQAQKIFDIANNTVPYLRAGLNMDTALATAKIIYERMPVAAVAITDSSQVLAHVGAGGDHHLSGKPIRTRSTRNVIFTGKPIFLKHHSQIGCNHRHCPFYSAIIVPLKRVGQLSGH